MCMLASINSLDWSDWSSKPQISGPWLPRDNPLQNVERISKDYCTFVTVVCGLWKNRESALARLNMLTLFRFTACIFNIHALCFSPLCKITCAKLLFWKIEVIRLVLWVVIPWSRLHRFTRVQSLRMLVCLFRCLFVNVSLFVSWHYFSVSAFPSKRCSFCLCLLAWRISLKLFVRIKQTFMRQNIEWPVFYTRLPGFILLFIF